MIPEAILNQIQERTDIVEVISGYVPLKRAGRNFKAPCPFHQEKTPSFMVSADKQIFHCFGCGAGGNVFGFLMKMERKDFPEVVETLAERVGVEIPKDTKVNAEAEKRTALLVKANQAAADFYHQFLLKRPEAQKAREYLRRRGIEEKTVSDFKLGYAPDSWEALCHAVKNEIPQKALEKAGLILPKKDGGGFYDRFRQRVIFPILDAKGVCVAFGARVLDGSLPKYLNSPETEIYSKGRHLYGLYRARKAIREKDAAIVVEGYLDLIACHQAGVENVVAGLGTALTAEQVRLIRRHTKNVFMLYDADRAGELATLRGLELFLEEELEVQIVRLPKGHDPDSFIRERGSAAFGEELGKAKTLFEYRLSLLKEKHDAGSVEGKVRIANEMVALFSKARNEILKAAWLRELAEELSISEEALAAELKKSTPRPPPVRVSALQGAALAKEEIPAVEKLMLGLLLDHPDYAARAKGEIRTDDFQNYKARELAARILGGQAHLAVSGMISLYNEDPLAVRLLSLASAEAETVVDKEKTFLDCVVWMKRSRIKNQREGLHVQLLAAQAAGDKNRIHQLLYDFNELNKGIKKINEKK